MAPNVFLCDGAKMPARWQGEIDQPAQRLNHSGLDPEVNLQIENLSHVLLGSIDGRAADLVKIASYAYSADQSVSRGGEADVYGRKWHRQMRLAIPVSDPRFWQRRSTSTALQVTLGFVSNDTWEFHFTKAKAEQSQLTLQLPEDELHSDPDCVVLFSGGADSLGAAVEAIQSGRRPLLVSHRTSLATDARRHRLVQELRQCYPDGSLPEIGAWIHLRGGEARERTQRTRSFLFASLASACAHHLGIGDVVLADNGVVSVNLPINRQFTGALASRSTHPKFLRLFNALLVEVFADPPRVRNPLWNRTRSEALRLLVESGNADLLEATISCSRARGLTRAMPQCGYCSQCVDRRFGAIRAGVEVHDPGERYGRDIFTDELPEGEARTVAMSYLTFARTVERLNDEELFKEFPELYDCASNEAEARELLDMLRRHAESVLGAMAEVVAREADALAAGSLPNHCLVRLAADAGEPERDHEERFRHSPDYAMVVVDGREYHLSPLRAAAVRVLHEACLQGVPELNGQYILAAIESNSTGLSDVFKRSPAWGTLVVSGATRGAYRLNI